MSVDYGEAPHIQVPDHGQMYANGDRLDIAEGPDGKPELRPNPAGKYLILGSRPIEAGEDGMLDVSLYQCS